MRDLIESILPRTYLSELDEEYGIVDVEEVLEALDLDLDDHCLSATSVVLQKKFAMMNVESALGIFAAYAEMCVEIEALNDWRSESHALRPCSLRAFSNHITAIHHCADELIELDAQLLDAAA